MSLKPGIGSTWLKRFGREVYPFDEVIMNGRPQKPPRYYDKKLLQQLDCLDEVLFKRYQRARACIADSTDERLAVREQVATARLHVSVRSLEKFK